MNSQERNQLIDALIEGDISEADFLRLEAELSVDPAARKAYYDRLALSTLLEAEAAQPSIHSHVPIPVSTQGKGTWEFSDAGLEPGPNLDGHGGGGRGVARTGDDVVSTRAHRPIICRQRPD